MDRLYVRIPDEASYKKAVVAAYVSPWMFSFPGERIPKYQEAKKYYHGNSKLLVRLFYNDITNKFEMQITTKSIELSYPQIKKLNIVDIDDLNYEMACKIFGEKR